MCEAVKHCVMKSLLRTDEGSTIFVILLAVMMTYKNGDVLELLKIHGQGQETRQGQTG